MITLSSLRFPHFDRVHLPYPAASDIIFALLIREEE
jgi:hypothetical protein